MCTATTAFNMISKHPLWGIKVTCLSLSLRCQYIWCHDVFKSPFANVKINLSLSVNKICNIICAVVTHLILHEEFNHRKRNSFFFVTSCYRMYARKSDLPSPGRGDMRGSLQGYLLHCFHFSLFRWEGT